MRVVIFFLKTMELYLMQMKHKIWSYFVKRFFDNKPAWCWRGSYHHWDHWCQAKISVLGCQRRGDRHYRWYEQKRVRDISSLDFSGTKETIGESVCACRVRVKLCLLIEDGVFKNSFHWRFPNVKHWKWKHISVFRDSIWKQKHVSVSKYCTLETETRFRFPKMKTGQRVNGNRKMFPIPVSM